MYIRKHKGKWRFAECYPDPLTGKKREVSIVLDKNTPQTRKEASALLQEKIRAKRAETTPGEMTVEELTKKFVAYQYQMWKSRPPSKTKARCGEFASSSAPMS